MRRRRTGGVGNGRNVGAQGVEIGLDGGVGGGENAAGVEGGLVG